MRLLILTLLFVVWNSRAQTTLSMSTTTSSPVKPATYILVAPSVVRPDQPYSVCMNLLKPPIDEEMIVRIEVRTDQNETIAARVMSNLKPGVAQTVSLSEMPAQSLTRGQSYKIWIRGETLNSEVIFENERDLKFDEKALSVFIQTDRAIYRPASLVRYRIVVVKSDLKPFVGNATVKIMDPSRNLISQNVHVPLDRGVIGGELQLAEETLLGDWIIEVETSNGMKDQTSFTVDTYVLPKFEVSIKTSSFITVNDDLSVFVDAKYTYGKGVAGKAKVSLELPWHRWQPAIATRIIDDGGIQKEEELMVERTVKLNRQGEAAVVFSNAELKKHKLLHEWGGGSIRIVASVTEDITEIERNTTHQISTYREEVKLDVEKQGDTFKPGLTYNVVVALKQMDDTPVKATLPRRVQVSTFYNYPYNHDTSSLQEEKEVKIVEVDAHGTSVLTLQPPINCTSARIEAHYDIGGSDNFTATPIYTSLYVEAAVSPTKSFLQLLADNEGAVDVGKSLSFSLKATQPLTSITYQVMSRSNIVLSQQMNVNSEHATITFQATSNMAPKSRLIVYAIREHSQEVLVDALDFKVDGIFQNAVSLSVDKQAVEPGQNVKIKVTSHPNSFVGVLVVDQSVLLLKSGNDVTREKVEADLENYDSNNFAARSWEAIDKKRRRRSIWRPWWGIGGNDAQSIFTNAGLVVLTDALLYREEVPREFVQAMTFDSPVMRTAVADASFGAEVVQPPTIRKFFPHTWIWRDLNSTKGEIELDVPAPDTITSWVASAFAINDEAGLGISSTNAKLRVFRPFFIQLNLPYSVRRGEKFALLVLVFNYMEKEQDVTVTLKYDQDSGYDLLKKDGTIVERNEVGQQNVRVVSVAGGGTSKAVYFPIVPSAIGEIPIHVTAVASQGGDGVEMALRVDPQGYRVDRNIPFVIDLNANGTNGGEFRRSLDLVWPNDVVDGSQKARIDVIGDLMGPVLSNAHQLVRMPFGCGEQNMLNLVPNILVLKYLRATKREDGVLVEKAIKFIESGIQRELTYKRTDNSFSAFGNDDKAGSTWLTAFVVRSFHHAQEFVFVDKTVISRAIAFLNSQQMESGAFAERGEVHHKDMQGGAHDGGIALTAFVLISLLENGVTNQKALAYLERNIDESAPNAYTMAVVSYALHLAKSKKVSKADEMLKKHRVDEKDGSIRFTNTHKAEKSKDSSAYLFQARPVDIETTSYALLSYLATNATSDSVPIVRWLIAQRNEFGGFTSTQDTVMALQALSAYAAATYSDNMNSQLTVINEKHSHTFEINPRNSIVLQSYQISNLNDAISVNASGSGIIFAQLSYSYYRDKLNDDAPFFCSQEIKEMRAGNRLQLDLCCNYTKTGKSNMVLAEIEALSGYRFDTEQVGGLKSIEDLQRVEIDNDDTKMSVYFNPLGAKPVCLSLYSDVTYQVADQKPANLRLLDYYDPEEQLKMTYTAKQTRSLQEKCGDDCWPPTSPSPPPTDTIATSSSAGTWQNWIAVCCEALVFSLLIRLL